MDRPPHVIFVFSQLDLHLTVGLVYVANKLLSSFLLQAMNKVLEKHSLPNGVEKRFLPIDNNLCFMGH